MCCVPKSFSRSIPHLLNNGSARMFMSLLFYNTLSLFPGFVKTLEYSTPCLVGKFVCALNTNLLSSNLLTIVIELLEIFELFL